MRRKKRVVLDDVFKRHFAERITVDLSLVIIFEERLARFRTRRNDPSIRDHALGWDMQGLRAFSITKDIRLVYEETDTKFIFRDIGTHSQVY